MARKRYKAEEIVSLLRQAEVLHGQGVSMADAIRQLGISEVTFYRWRKEYGGMSGDQLRRLASMVGNLLPKKRTQKITNSAKAEANIARAFVRIPGLSIHSGNRILSTPAELLWTHFKDHARCQYFLSNGPPSTQSNTISASGSMASALS